MYYHDAYVLTQMVVPHCFEMENKHKNKPLVSA